MRDRERRKTVSHRGSSYVQDILRSKLGILSRSGTAMVAILDGRFDVPLAFDTSHLFFYAYL